jgi:PAS domain S-box-containing protein
LSPVGSKGRGRAATEELRRTQLFLERLVDGSRDAVVACDMKGHVVLFNKAAERLTRYGTAEAMRSLRAAKLYDPAVLKELLARLRSARAGGRVAGLATEIRTRYREAIPVSLSASLLVEGGVEIAWVAVLEDQRERISIERRLSTAEEKLREKEKQAMLAELAGTAAHELNQPLTSVLGYADLLRRRVPESDPNHRAIAVIYREAERMAQIVRKIGRITRYETTTYLGDVKIVDLDKSTKG